MISPFIYNTKLKKGTTFRRSFFLKQSDGTAFDLTNITFVGELRRTENDPNVIPITVTTNPLLGKITLSILSNITKDINFPSGDYDIIMFSGGEPFPLMEGTITISPKITQF